MNKEFWSVRHPSQRRNVKDDSKKNINKQFKTLTVPDDYASANYN